MQASKFSQLCAAYSNAQTNFENFRLDCHSIASLLVDELKAYMGVPEKQFSLYRVNQNNEFQVVPPSLVNALVLSPDSYWHFGVGLTVCKSPESLQEELILIHLMVRKEIDNQFFVKYANHEEEFEVFKGQAESFHPFLDFLHETIIESYNDRLQQFLGEKTERKLGYVR
ncbi:hypothetical protein GWK08_12970 [Leptobacterium flavescens]|uniref:Uncharacterized protein n=1 Tax=Leptobacterium flavescens TaxID=472055 RepID=A0A6P0UQT9_9FLAO|nr:hypothetical protein [Leptobacterium flavescens]NER14358.1 hypothetical protein [Leptobacterium flavescens]